MVGTDFIKLKKHAKISKGQLNYRTAIPLIFPSPIKKNAEKEKMKTAYRPHIQMFLRIGSERNDAINYLHISRVSYHAN